MSITWRIGLLHALTRDELARVLHAVEASCVTDRASHDAASTTAFADYALRDDGALDVIETDPGSIRALERLFAKGGVVASSIAGAAELGVLVPGAASARFDVARSVDGVEGFFVKRLATAITEVEGRCAETGEDAAELLAALRRADELMVGVVVGERR